MPSNVANSLNGEHDSLLSSDATCSSKSLVSPLSRHADEVDANDIEEHVTSFISNGLSHVMCTAATRTNMNTEAVFKKFIDLAKQTNAATDLNVDDHRSESVV